MLISPLPGSMLNYLLRQTGVLFAHYTLGIFLIIVPRILNLILIGNSAKNVGGGVALKLAMMAAMVSVMIYITRMAAQTFYQTDDVEHQNGQGNGSTMVAMTETEKTSLMFSVSVELTESAIANSTLRIPLPSTPGHPTQVVTSSQSPGK